MLALYLLALTLTLGGIVLHFKAPGNLAYATAMAGAAVFAAYSALQGWQPWLVALFGIFALFEGACWIWALAKFGRKAAS